MEEQSPRALIMPAPATLHKIHLALNRLREATHAARSIIMQGWNGPLGCYLHLSVFPATSNLLMIIKEQRGPAALWKQGPSQPGMALHPQSSWIKAVVWQNQEKLAGRLPWTTCKPPATPGWDGYSKYREQHAVISKILFCGCTNLGDGIRITVKTSDRKEQQYMTEKNSSCTGRMSVWTLRKSHIISHVTTVFFSTWQLLRIKLKITHVKVYKKTNPNSSEIKW